MDKNVDFRVNTASALDVARHLAECDELFVPNLSGRLNIEEYAKKIHESAEMFEAWSAGTLIGLVAAYCNDAAKRTAFITSVSLSGEWSGQGIASTLAGNCVAHAKSLGFALVKLEVSPLNQPALKLYKRLGFTELSESSGMAVMQLIL